MRIRTKHEDKNEHEDEDKDEYEDEDKDKEEDVNKVFCGASVFFGQF